jgi:hypothetical protein
MAQYLYPPDGNANMLEYTGASSGMCWSLRQMSLPAHSRTCSMLQHLQCTTIGGALSAVGNPAAIAALASANGSAEVPASSTSPRPPDPPARNTADLLSNVCPDP